MKHEEKLSKIKHLIEQSMSDETKKNFYLGQAVAIIDDMIESPNETPSSIEIPSHILQQMKPDSDATMETAVNRHLKLHKELSDNAISKENTKFKKLS